MEQANQVKRFGKSSLQEGKIPRNKEEAAFSVRLLQLQQVAENPSLEQEEFLYICACQSDKQSLGFLNTDPQSQVLFN